MALRYLAICAGTDPKDFYARTGRCRVSRPLAEGSHVQAPIQETFWARRFGMVVDRFGTPWMIAPRE